MINATIQGTTPLLCNRFTDANQLAATSGTRISTVGDRGTPREIAEQKLYRSAKDPSVLIIPAPNLYRCIMDAGTFFKAGKSKVTTLKSSLIPSCLAIEEAELPIEHTDDWEVDIRAVRIPSTGGRILAYRPFFQDWKLHFTLTLDETIMGERLLRDIVDAAGKRIGLGDFRPATKGPYGKFVVVRWESCI